MSREGKSIETETDRGYISDCLWLGGMGVLGDGSSGVVSFGDNEDVLKLIMVMVE